MRSVIKCAFVFFRFRCSIRTKSCKLHNPTHSVRARLGQVEADTLGRVPWDRINNSNILCNNLRTCF